MAVYKGDLRLTFIKIPEPLGKYVKSGEAVGGEWRIYRLYIQGKMLLKVPGSYIRDYNDLKMTSIFEKCSSNFAELSSVV